MYCASDIHPDSPFSDDKHGQNAANTLENAIFTAAAGDLRAYQQIFRQIYLNLKTQSVLVLRWKRLLSEETQESKYK
jgi:hypothetical protein